MKGSVFAAYLILFVLTTAPVSCASGQVIAAVDSRYNLYTNRNGIWTTTDLMAALGFDHYPLGDAVAFNSAGDLYIATQEGLYKTTPDSGVFTNMGPMPSLFMTDLALWQPVPEPSSIFVLLCGIGGLGGVMWRRKSA